MTIARRHLLAPALAATALLVAGAVLIVRAGTLPALLGYLRRRTPEPRLITAAAPAAARALLGVAVAIAAAAIDYWPDSRFDIPAADLVLYALGWSSAAIAGARGVMRAGGQPKALHLLGMPLYWLAQSAAAAKALVKQVRWLKLRS